ncbi:MAG: D-aminoacylase [Acidobacteriota bacterium]|nr:D-aminoacylase [Acidobacteriota bacterium]
MRILRTAFRWLALVGALACASSAGTLLLQNAVVYDGTGRPGFRADLRIDGERIVAVAPHLKPRPGESVRDVHGLALAPGFLDMHSHADARILEIPTADNVIRQGITTVLVGQDGASPYPLADFLGRLEKAPPALNVASMAGHGTLRQQVMGEGKDKDLLRPSTAAELEKMRRLLDQEMQTGAFGLSSGLEYDAGHFATTDELVELAKVAHRYGGFYISHVRDEGNGVFDSFREAIEIGRRSGVPVEISHIKLATTPNWHLARSQMPAIFRLARAQGVDLKADVYPYTFWQSELRVIVLDRDYFNPEKVAKAIAENGGAENLRLTRYQPDPALSNKTLKEFADHWQVTPAQAFMRIVRETMPGADGKSREDDILGTSMVEDDLRWFLAHPRIMFCTDGEIRGKHPRSAGAFPRILGPYVRGQKVLPLAAAIHKMTALPAAQLGLTGRGRIAPGYWADLVLFDPAQVRDTSTVEDPDAPPDGIVGVMVAGQWVVDQGKITGARPGKVLRHRSARRAR